MNEWTGLRVKECLGTESDKIDKYINSKDGFGYEWTNYWMNKWI